MCFEYQEYFKHLLGGPGDILTGIGIFFFSTPGSGVFLAGFGIGSLLGVLIGRSFLDLRPALSFLGRTLAGDSDWRRILLGERDLVLDLK